jgi:hypothetical protein
MAIVLVEGVEVELPALPPLWASSRRSEKQSGSLFYRKMNV